MIPQYVRQVAPDKRGQQLAGFGARAAAGIGQAVAGLGGQIAAFGDARTERGDVLAGSKAFRTLDEWRILALRDLRKKQSELSRLTVDPVSGQTVKGYQIELDAFPDSIKAKFDEISMGLSAKARSQLELRYNEAAPSWAAQVVQILDGMERADVVTEAQSLARGGRAADALELVDLHKDILGPELHEQLSSQSLIFGAMADLQELAASDPDGWTAAARRVQDPDFQKTYGLDLPQANEVRKHLAAFVDVQHAQQITAIETAREKDRDALNDRLAAGELTYEQIDASSLDESEQRQYADWAQQDAERRLSGRKTVTDELVRHDLKAQALDIPRGRADYRDVVNKATAAKAAGQLDEEGYRDVLASARSELSGLHAETLRTVSRSAERQIVTVSESVLERFSQLMASGNKGAQALLNTAQNQRQTEYRLVDLHDSRMRAFVQSHPDASAEDLYRESRRTLLSLRRSSPAERAHMLDQFDQDAAAQPAGPPSGLETIWGDLSPEEQATVQQLMQRGFTADDLLRHYRLSRPFSR